MIRRARLSDLQHILPLWHELMAFHMRRTGPMLALAPDAEKRWGAFAKKNIRSPNGLVLVAEIDGEIVGYSLNFIKNNVPVYRLRRLGYMSDLFVKEAHRGKGISSAFRKEAFAWFRKRGMRYASIVVHAINPDAKRIYRGWGFAEQHIEMRRRL
jgi:GNAT superfamily N-acetyltransferase